jgi:hypothetical protein
LQDVAFERRPQKIHLPGCAGCLRVPAITCQTKRRVSQREEHAPMTNAIPIQHAKFHSHVEAAATGVDSDKSDALLPRSMIFCLRFSPAGVCCMLMRSL